MDEKSLNKKLLKPQPRFIVGVDMASGKDQTAILTITINKEPEVPITQNVFTQIGDNCPKQNCGGTITHNWQTGQTKCNRCDFVIVKDDKE